MSLLIINYNSFEEYSTKEKVDYEIDDYVESTGRNDMETKQDNMSIIGGSPVAVVDYDD